MNLVNREHAPERHSRENSGATAQNGSGGWANVRAAQALFARAERELRRKPGVYVAVAVVRADKGEEQVERWSWAGPGDAGGRVAGAGKRVVGDARGLRVRVHRNGGGLFGSVLLRRTRATGTTPVPRAVEPIPFVPASRAEAAEPDKFAAMEVALNLLLVRISAQDREIALLKAEVADLPRLRAAADRFHRRLDDLEAVSHGQDAHGDDQEVGDEQGYDDDQEDEDDERDSDDDE